METLCGGSNRVKTIRMAKNKNILFPETAQKENDVAAPEPLRNAYDAVREGEGGEQEEAQHVSLGQWGPLEIMGLRRSTMMECKICLTSLMMLGPNCFLSGHGELLVQIIYLHSGYSE